MRTNMHKPTIYPGLLIVLAATLLAACSGSEATSVGSHPVIPGQRPTPSLPPGFSLAATPGAVPTPSELAVAPVTSLDTAALRRGPFPRAQLQDITQAIVNEPEPTRVRPLLVSPASFRPGQTLTVAAGDLPDFPHDVEFILQGPGLRAQRLVRVTDGIAVGAVTLPATLSPGTWALAAEDLSGVQATGTSPPTGTVLLDLTIFTISR